MGSFEEPKMATFNTMRSSFFEGAITFIYNSDLTKYVLRKLQTFIW